MGISSDFSFKLADPDVKTIEIRADKFSIKLTSAGRLSKKDIGVVKKLFSALLSQLKELK